MRLNNKALPRVRVPTLNEILNANVEGFKRLEIRVEECRMATSKKGKLRFVLLIEKSNRSRLHGCYCAAVIMMFRKYKLGDSPIFEAPADPIEFKSRYVGAYNLVKDLPPTKVHRYSEFIHTQAELLFKRYKNSSYWSYWDGRFEPIL